MAEKKRPLDQGGAPLRGRQIDLEAARDRAEEQEELARFYDEGRRYIEPLLARGRRQEADEGFWARLDRGDYRDTWAEASKPPGPPPDPPPQKPGGMKRASSADLWRYDHRGFLSRLIRRDGTRLNFGYPPHVGKNRTNPYYGYSPPRMGRPPKPDKLTAAQKQKAYRARKRRA
jgi:hypothetical protein